MNSIILKQLVEAGFDPTNGFGLSELIKSFGEDFDKVGQDPNRKGVWLARVFSVDKIASGNSPDEAVAYLFLATRS